MKKIKYNLCRGVLGEKKKKYSKMLWKVWKELRNLLFKPYFHYKEFSCKFRRNRHEWDKIKSNCRLRKIPERKIMQFYTKCKLILAYCYISKKFYFTHSFMQLEEKCVYNNIDWKIFSPTTGLYPMNKLIFTFYFGNFIMKFPLIILYTEFTDENSENF